MKNAKNRIFSKKAFVILEVLRDLSKIEGFDLFFLLSLLYFALFLDENASNLLFLLFKIEIPDVFRLWASIKHNFLYEGLLFFPEIEPPYPSIFFENARIFNRKTLFPMIFLRNRRKT